MTVSLALVSEPTGRGLVVWMLIALKVKGCARATQSTLAGLSPIQLTRGPAVLVKLAAAPVGYLATIPVIGLLALFLMLSTSVPVVVPDGTRKLPETVTRVEP